LSTEILHCLVTVVKNGKSRPKSRKRVLLFLEIVLFVGIGSAAAGYFASGPLTGIALYRDRAICLRCGRQSSETTITFLGLRPRNKGLSSAFAGIEGIDTEHCLHNNFPIGACRKFIDFAALYRGHGDQGVAHGDFFAATPSLREALSLIARTNRIVSERALQVVLRLRFYSAPAEKRWALPSLYSTNVASLKAELEREVSRQFKVQAQ
jgi:hypothetical protein